MDLKEAFQRARLTYRPVAKTLGLSASAISRLVLYGEYPLRIGADEVKRKLAEVFDRHGLKTSAIEWPDMGVRPAYDGTRRARTTGMEVQRHERVHQFNDRYAHEELDLMQLSNETLRLFGLRVNPFLNDTENDEDIYRSRGYEMVDAAIREAIEARGFLAVIAESGSGKTTIWDGIEAEYGSRSDTVICRPEVKSKERMTAEHLARCLIYGLLGEDVVCKANAEDRGRQLSHALRAIRSEANDRKVVLLIDDAHFCTASVLRQLKTFYEEKIGRYRLMTIILVGLPTLKTKLAEFPEIGNRIRLVEVPPVPVQEYLAFKFKRVGSALDKVFAPDGLQAFLERFQAGPRKASIGRPLVVNACCIRAMVMLQQSGAQAGEKITRELIDSMPGQTMSRRVA